MMHRHLNHEEWSVAAIDDVISRGKRRDWGELRLAIMANPAVLEKIQQVCRARMAEEDGQRYDFVFVDQTGFEKHAPKNFAALAASFTDYKG